jgi:hypothetical protein
MDTPWGPIHIYEGQAQLVNAFVLKLSQTFEFDKPYVARVKARFEAEEDAIKPVAEFWAAPEKVEQEIARLASENAVHWAEQTETADDLSVCLSIFLRSFRSNRLTVAVARFCLSASRE